MARKEVLAKPRRVACVGDLSDRIVLSDRALFEPFFQGVDFDELFKCGSGRWARVKSTAGKVFFSGINVDVAISHEVIIRWDPKVTTETWVLLESGERLAIATFEDLDERHQFLRLLCTSKGDKAKAASKV